MGSYLSGDLYIFYYSYASDILAPIGFYFSLCANDVQFRFLRNWHVKALAIFMLATFAEIMQSFGFYLLGETFAVMDILMFALGVMITAFLNVKVFEKLIPGYKIIIQ